jgi:hypothetical protein
MKRPCLRQNTQGWGKTRCVQASPTGISSFVKMEDSQMTQIAERENLEWLLNEKGTQPGVYYRNLYRYEKCSITGSVAFKPEEMTDCADGTLLALFSFYHTLQKWVSIKILMDVYNFFRYILKR